MPLSIEELKELSQEVFEANPNATHVLAFSDGNIFLPENGSYADLHRQTVKAEPYEIPNPLVQAETEGLAPENDDPSLLGDQDTTPIVEEEVSPKKATKKEQAKPTVAEAETQTPNSNE